MTTPEIPHDDDETDFTMKIASAARLGFSAEWPETFDYHGKTWTKEHLVVAANGEVQCGEYVSGTDYLVVYGEGESE